MDVRKEEKKKNQTNKERNSIQGRRHRKTSLEY